jgi:PTS system nitrogen regulatory IIA component
LDTQDKEFNSASGRGVAYHYHASIEVKETLAVLGISKGGIDYHASDRLLCNFILLILEPKDNLNRHRKFISLFQNLIKDSNIKSKLLEATSTNEAETIIREWENKENYDIL